MPELPEVEVTRLGLVPHLPGHRVRSLFFSGKKLRRPIARRDMARWIRGARVHSLDRRGKYLLIRMDNKAVLLIHLGMSGTLGIFRASQDKIKHDHVVLRFDNNKELRFNDARRFGSVELWKPALAERKEAELSARLGVEPLGRRFTARRMLERAKGRRQSVKTFIMDGKSVVGLGNIYANEALFLAAIHPAKPAGELSHKHWLELVKTSKKVLKDAIMAGGSSISDYLNSSGEPGYFQLQLNVYGRAGELCPRCGLRCGASIEKTVITGRASFFCAVCQN